MDASVMSTPIRRVDAHADCPSDVAAREAYQRLGPALDPICQLEQAIESVLSHPRVGVRLTASIIGTSVRTLQRQLADQGTSFSRLLHAVRFRHAKSLIEDPNMPLKVIANRLGYTDSANFCRAFKRWTGVSPREFRRLHYEDRC
jgi:AraC-like DNA-binding protein